MLNYAGREAVMQINNSFQKNANMSMAARLLWRSPGISRIDIAKKLGVYRSTISNIINTLVENGVVLESRDKTGSSLGGRKPLRLELNPDFGCVVGIEIQPSGYTVVVTDFIGVVRFSRSDSLPEGPFELLPDRILEKVAADIHSVGLFPLAVCMGMPGIINSCEGIVVRSDIFNASNVSFPCCTEALNGVPFYIENEANCIAWMELLRKREQDCRSLLCVNTEYTRDASRFSQCSGLAIGIGVALDGRVYGGSHSAAGEFVTCRWNDGKLGQGNFSVPAGAHRIEQPVLAGWIQELFESLVPVVSIFDPHVIIIHGEFARHRDEVQNVLEHDVPRFGDILKQTGCELVFSDGDPRSVAIGAAHMFLMRLFSLPVMDENSHKCQNWDDVFICARRIVQNTDK